MASPLHTTQAQANPFGIAVALVGAFVVGSLAVQLVATAPRPARTGSSSSGPRAVVAHPSTLWQSLGER